MLLQKRPGRCPHGRVTCVKFSVAGFGFKFLDDSAGVTWVAVHRMTRTVDLPTVIRELNGVLST